jgi:hypothetical protein
LVRSVQRFQELQQVAQVIVAHRSARYGPVQRLTVRLDPLRDSPLDGFVGVRHDFLLAMALAVLSRD